MTRTSHLPKSFPSAAAVLDVRDWPDQQWRVPQDFSTPIAVLSQSALDNNHQVMRAFSSRHGVDLAPHGKTTMAPLIISQQLAAGAWGMTAATPWQARTMIEAGASRVIIANEVMDPAGLAWIRATMEADPALTMWVYVDSVAGAERVSQRLGPGTRSVPVLLEVGLPGGRGGAREVSTAVDVAEAVARLDGIVLSGVAAFEGAYPDRVTEILARMGAVLKACRARGLMVERPMFTAGGSSHFDAVVAAASGLTDVHVVLRSGCYITHDDGVYAANSPLAGPAGLQPALRVWARVIAVPEQGLALIDAGRRDLTTEGIMPLVTAIIRAGREVAAEPVRVDRVNDQHGFLRTDHLQLDDLVQLGISHPCLTFDKWRVIPVVDDHGVATTFAWTVF